ncbi:alpha/beta hydrolase [Dactylosporangium vinaceum]|uniref:Alpha/beta fold hydrolase n=1 Tax=Dactylosporangium vinaceum TaxID=53362 RepID=A0ABV5M224_9ACTN|nr:alpha/beta fold hydrolase [Dactylosporangium vinaceum]UAB99391.1 alpha/beta hydrolase [Dactylosporangium vinaceum]
MIKDGHDTRVLSHGSKRERSVLLLHGYTHSPAQLAPLAALFYGKGYNVVVPRAPGHGLLDPDGHATITARGLLAYATESLATATALGAETGVLGVSGGGVLATWLAARHPASVRRLVVLAPLYAPHRSQVPPAARPALRVLYGHRLIPDKHSSRGYSYRAVAQYLRIAAGLPRRFPATGPHRVAAVLAPGDTTVDGDLAFGLPARIAAAAGAALTLDTLPSQWGLGHDIISAHRLGTLADALYRRYVALYEAS